MPPLFAYGTLCLNPIRQYFFGGQIGTSALLMGYKRVKIVRLGSTLVYPALIADETACCEGLLFYNLQPSDWHKIDDYEGDLYRRMEVMAQANDRQIQAITYVWNSPDGYSLTNEEWSPSSISNESILNFLAEENLDSTGLAE